ncbi:MAG: hypothetical protein IIC75_00375 [Bacteroidetes bacterium]|nr:hypothetical protein [Bacteroidota bacterium]
MKYTKLCVLFVSENQPDYSELGIVNAKLDYEEDIIYVDLSCVSHFHKTGEKNINIFIYGEKWTIKANINEFENMINNN